MKHDNIEFAATPGDSERVIRRLESKLGVRFPKLLCAHLMSGREGWAKVTGYAEQSGFEYLSSKAIWEDYDEEFRDKFSKVIPFARFPNGDRICLDYRLASEPVLVVWRMAKAYSHPAPFHYIARDYDEFVRRCDPKNKTEFINLDATLTDGAISRLLGPDFLHPTRW